MDVIVHTLARLLRSWLHAAAIWFVVITLALLNPLACFIHCAMLDRVNHDHTAASALASFLCDMHLDSPSSAVKISHRDHGAAQGAATSHTNAATSDPVQTAVPRAVYESIPFLSLVLILALALLRVLDLPVLHQFPRRSDTPLLPPPRVA